MSRTLTIQITTDALRSLHEAARAKATLYRDEAKRRLPSEDATARQREAAYGAVAAYETIAEKSLRLADEIEQALRGDASVIVGACLSAGRLADFQASVEAIRQREQAGAAAKREG